MQITHEQASDALDSLDDYARMSAGVDAKGPRETLEKYIEQMREIEWMYNDLCK